MIVKCKAEHLGSRGCLVIGVMNKMLLPCVIINKKIAMKDMRLDKEANRGRKVMVIKMRKDTDELEGIEWEPGKLVETKCGGLEVATFNEKTEQDKHLHKLATEIYTVLDGKMKIEVDNIPYDLETGDEIIVFPGSVHQVLPSDDKFLARVHTVNCHGESDKYKVS